MNIGKILLRPRGNYSETDKYSMFDIVIYNGTTYLCISDIEIENKIPDENDDIWKAITEKIDLNKFENHLNNLNNPHNVTAEQIDTYIKSEIDEKIDEIKNEISKMDYSPKNLIQTSILDLSNNSSILLEPFTNFRELDDDEAIRGYRNRHNNIPYPIEFVKFEMGDSYKNDIHNIEQENENPEDFSISVNIGFLIRSAADLAFVPEYDVPSDYVITFNMYTNIKNLDDSEMVIISPSSPEGSSPETNFSAKEFNDNVDEKYEHRIYFKIKDAIIDGDFGSVLLIDGLNMKYYKGMENAFIIISELSLIKGNELPRTYDSTLKEIASLNNKNEEIDNNIQKLTDDGKKVLEKVEVIEGSHATKDDLTELETKNNRNIDEKIQDINIGTINLIDKSLYTIIASNYGKFIDYPYSTDGKAMLLKTEEIDGMIMDIFPISLNGGLIKDLPYTLSFMIKAEKDASIDEVESILFYVHSNDVDDKATMTIIREDLGKITANQTKLFSITFSVDRDIAVDGIETFLEFILKGNSEESNSLNSNNTFYLHSVMVSQGNVPVSYNNLTNIINMTNGTNNLITDSINNFYSNSVFNISDKKYTTSIELVDEDKSVEGKSISFKFDTEDPNYIYDRWITLDLKVKDLSENFIEDRIYTLTFEMENNYGLNVNDIFLQGFYSGTFKVIDSNFVKKINKDTAARYYITFRASIDYSKDLVFNFGIQFLLDSDVELAGTGNELKFHSIVLTEGNLPSSFVYSSSDFYLKREVDAKIEELKNSIINEISSNFSLIESTRDILTSL